MAIGGRYAMNAAAQRLFALLAVLLATLAPWGPAARAGTAAPRVHVVSFGLWGDQNLFMREAVAAADAIAARYGRTGQVIVRANTTNRSAARILDLRDALHGLASTIDVDNDILFLFLTSHGNPEGLGVKAFNVPQVFPLSPERLGGMLRVAGIRHRVVVISACFSGIFADAIADDETLVITAADANHSSFGCNADNLGNWTYFGEAFFADSLRPGITLDEAFQKARSRVEAREQAAQFSGSNPQMRGGAAVRPLLAQIP